MLRKVAITDFDYIYQLYMNEEVNPYLLYEMMSKNEFQPIFNALLNEQVLYLYLNEGEVIGMCKLIRQKYRCDHVMYLGGLAIHPLHAGKGFGIKIIQEIVDLCSDMEILRIELSVAEHNTRAIKLYEKSGFEKEGILRNYAVLKKENKMFNEILMSYIF